MAWKMVAVREEIYDRLESYMEKKGIPSRGKAIEHLLNEVNDNGTRTEEGPGN